MDTRGILGDDVEIRVPPDQRKARREGAAAFGDSEGDLYCFDCAVAHRGLTPLKPRTFSASDRCSDCGVELRGPLKKGRFHEYERETVRELGEHLESWPIDDVQPD